MKLAYRLSKGRFNLNVDLKLPDTGISVLYGHSGCGKTTLLRCVAGLENEATGHCSIANEVWESKSIKLKPHKRDVGYVFQEPSLFSHLSVKDNLDYGIKRAIEASKKNLDETIAVLGIEHLLEQKPAALSGGEAQRVGIARALALNPKILLFDEPLASLDDDRKREILPYLKRIKRQLSIPMLYVTHAAPEVAMLADHVVVMHEGRVVSSDSLSASLTNEKLPLRLNGEISSVLTGKIIEIDKRWHLACLSISDQKLWLPNTKMSIGDEVRVQILSKDIALANSAGDASFQNVFKAKIVAINEGDHPSQAIVKANVGEHEFMVAVTKRGLANLGLRVGNQVLLQVKSVAIHS
ncbi:molybdenum ABC transporter ATP-binding protein [Aestuariibacter salexigens]|uniref:molybdenum ABC transporter ATP-binding protein n=1 Tax=Aestuariibacter salexigens TaxID=226010 RepID=UPI00040DFEED|nr:molybdenum ABC transporter ATP-binding protein [Aestuariibacter salexigens]